MKIPPPEYTAREERIAIKIDSHIPEFPKKKRLSRRIRK